MGSSAVDTKHRQSLIFRIMSTPTWQVGICLQQLLDDLNADLTRRVSEDLRAGMSPRVTSS